MELVKLEFLSCLYAIIMYSFSIENIVPTVVFLYCGSISHSSLSFLTN